MLRTRFALLVFLLLSGLFPIAVLSGSSANADVESSARAPLAGTWRLLSFEARLGDGRVIYPFGTDAGGLLEFTRDGHMAAAVWKANRTNFAINDWQKGTPEEYTAAMSSYIQYMGVVSVDRERGTLSTDVITSALPNWVGTTQTRFYDFSEDGNQLELTTPPVPFGGTNVVGALVWERVVTE